MYSMDALLHLIHSDGADALRLGAGEPPVVVMDGQPQKLVTAALTPADVEQLLQSITDTRQRRELWDHGRVEFIYRFRDRVNFVVIAKLDGEHIRIEVH